MKKIIIIGIISVILIVAGLVTSYIDSARVRNSIEPKFTIKIVSDGGNKITYWGLGYKVIRYPSVSPNEPYKNNLGVKYGSWFMKYELSNYESIDIELIMDDKIIQVSKTRDIEFIIKLLEDSKYINGHCNGINTHKIKIGDELYYLKESCSEIQKGNKQATLSEEDLNKLLKIIDNYNENDVKLLDDNKVEKEYIENFEVSGYLKISKYNLDIPVLKEATARSLEVSAGIIYGNGLNEIGNTTITGLYSKGDAFENIHKLEIGDEIIVVDQKKQEIMYEVYDKRNVKDTDSDYMIRDTNNKREITLHTGNYSGSINNRLIILAKEKE